MKVASGCNYCHRCQASGKRASVKYFFLTACIKSINMSLYDVSLNDLYAMGSFVWMFRIIYPCEKRPFLFC